MKTLLIAAAAVASLGAALPASAQVWNRGDHPVQSQVRPVEQRYDRDGRDGRDRFLSPWEIRRIEQRRAEERRRLEWQRHHHWSHEGYRYSGYGYGR